MLSRRRLLQYAASASALAATGAIPASLTSAFAAEEDAKRIIPWKNWSGAQSCTPSLRVAPSGEAELAEIVSKGTTPIRAVGAGHSFSGLVPTEGTLLSLDRMAGLVSADKAGGKATFKAGTRLGAMGTSLAENGLALDNMPDINKQTIAGAISTATHGTGADIGSLATFIDGMRLITGSGEALDLDARTNPDLFQAARVSLGALGIVTETTLAARPLYKLKKRTWTAPVEEMLEQAPELWSKHRNFEFYYIPYSGMTIGIINDLTDEPETPEPANEDDDGLRQLQKLQDWLGWSPATRRWLIQKILGGMEPETRVDYSHKTLSTERNMRFNEMEYHLPREAGPEALREVIETIEMNDVEVFFPIEFRTVAPDDIWLSPFYKRESCSIAVHRYHEEDYTPYFSLIEPIFRKHEGRPHWGKLNTLKAADFASLYPKWQDFLEVRTELDPEGRFLNPYLRDVFGVEA
ncbi:D-arabinono-1,4-lactone oxidase [Parvibaculum sp.]|jgi:FAD-linked oxidoreductase|uniref:D-arabinono-1,4-lactone oxidase n=1 Tax=Parvibaculum sp. TaxID=2024848 RepID=UPI0025DD63A3|nr:D-arabinono-1,4-lactone oxidase [Parvibaculum sp.]